MFDTEHSLLVLILWLMYEVICGDLMTHMVKGQEKVKGDIHVLREKKVTVLLI